MDSKEETKLMEIAAECLCKSGDDSDDFYWECICKLQRSASENVLDTCKLYSVDEDWAKRGVAVDICSEMGIRNESITGIPAFPDERETILINIAQEEKDSRVIEALGYALSHFKVPGAIEFLAIHKNHIDAEIRLAVAHGLCGYESEVAISSLLELMKDEDEDVRDWATFGIGTQIETDTDEIRDALYENLDVEYDGQYYEALNGLCERHDPRGMSLLKEIIVKGPADVWILDIAYETKSNEMLPYLHNIPKDQLSDEKILRAWKYAVKNCSDEEVFS